jgi:hypothetical protein
MLTGSDLHAKVKELGDVSKSNLVRAGGTMSAKKAGRERLNFTAFDEGMFEAKETLENPARLRENEPVIAGQDWVDGW